MAVLYVGLAVIIIITNITAVPAALASIVKSAFTGSALAGGAVAVSYTHLDVYKRQVIGVILLIGIYYYVTLPAINIHASEFWMYLVVLVILAAVVSVSYTHLRSCS